MIIDGKKEAELLRHEVKKEIDSLKLKNNKRFSQLVSAKSLKIIKRFLWNKVLKDIEKIL